MICEPSNTEGFLFLGKNPKNRLLWVKVKKKFSSFFSIYIGILNVETYEGNNH